MPSTLRSASSLREGAGLDSDQRLATLRHEWNFRMNTGLIASYRFDHVRQTFAETLSIEPIRTQTAEAGFRYEHRFSSIRAFNLSVTAGAAQVLAGPLTTVDGTVEPTGALTASYTLTSRWVIAANASRSITALQGVAVEPFSNDLASLSVSGVLGGRVTVSLTGALSRGDALGVGRWVVRCLRRQRSRAIRVPLWCPLRWLHPLRPSPQGRRHRTGRDRPSLRPKFSESRSDDLATALRRVLGGPHHASRQEDRRHLCPAGLSTAGMASHHSSGRGPVRGTCLLVDAVGHLPG